MSIFAPAFENNGSDAGGLEAAFSKGLRGKKKLKNS